MQLRRERAIYSVAFVEDVTLREQTFYFQFFEMVLQRFYFLFALISNIACILTREVPTVETKLGKVSGVYDTSYRGRIFSAFYGIPYAEPPIGDFRFQEPQPLKPWKGTWIANMTTTTCIQINHAPDPEGGSFTGEEDCLYLHVYVPAKQPGKVRDPLDVVVHFHGGAFMFGSGLCYAGPGFLMDTNVVLVTLNYRLGFLGFLSTEDGVVPGNNGMKDQVMALRWVKDNIRSFGGNPDSVTISGLSAGGASVHYHYLSPLSAGLFHRGISVSGCALTPWSLQENALEKAKFLASEVGCPTDRNEEMIKCLRTRPARQITEVTRLLRPWLYNPFSPLGLVVERAGENKFLPDYPYSLLSQGKFHDVPWLNSITSEEGLYPGADYVLKDNFLPDLDRRWKELAPSILDYNHTIPAKIQDEVSEKIKNDYLGDKPISRDTYKELIDMMSDRLFSNPAEVATKIQASLAESPVYFYYISFPDDSLESFTIHFAGQDQHDGVAHGDDIMYLFSIPFRKQKLTPLDEDIQEILLNIWKSFIQTNRPSVPNVEWTPVSRNTNDVLRQLHIRSPGDISMQDVNEIDRHRTTWSSIPLKENENLLVKSDRDEL